MDLLSALTLILTLRCFTQTCSDYDQSILSTSLLGLMLLQVFGLTLHFTPTSAPGTGPGMTPGTDPGGSCQLGVPVLYRVAPGGRAGACRTAGCMHRRRAAFCRGITGACCLHLLEIQHTSSP